MSQSKKKYCNWTPQALLRFSDLKQAPVAAPILAFPNLSLSILVQADASDNAIGSVIITAC
jgi:hypothetical protein